MSKSFGFAVLLVFVAGGLAVWHLTHRDLAPSPPDSFAGHDRTNNLAVERSFAAETFPHQTVDRLVPLAPGTFQGSVSDRLLAVGEELRLTGRVIDLDGAPLAGARVVSLPSGPTLRAAGLPFDRWVIRTGDIMSNFHYFATVSRLSLADLPQTRTDADGRATIESRHLPVEPEHSLIAADGMPRSALLVTCPGFTHRVVWLDETGASDTDLGDIRLEPETIVHGVAVDETGRPLAGVRVRIWRESIAATALDGNASGEQPFLPELMQAVTGADGRFELRGLWSGNGSIELKTTARVRQEIPVELTAGQPLDVGQVEVPPGSAIAGRVHDAGGEPVVRATVRAIDGELHWFGEGTDSIHTELRQAEADYAHDAVLADEAGRFRIGGLASPTLSLYVSAEGFEPARVRPVAAGTEDVQIVLEREARLHVRVIDRGTGAALPDATLQVFRESRIEMGQHDVELAVESTGPGEFVARGAGPLSQRAIASAPGHETVTASCPGVLPPGSAEAIVELGPEAVLAGHVRDARGRPVQGATVELHEPGKLRVPTLSVRTDEQGGFRIAQLAELTTLVVAAAEGQTETVPLEVTLASGEHREDLELRLPAPATIHGAVFGADGQIRPSFTVRIEAAPYEDTDFMNQSARIREWIHTDEHGQYAFAGLRAGEYRLSVYGCDPVILTVGEGEDRPLDFRSRPVVTVRGHVTSAGAPVVTVPVTAKKDRHLGGEPLSWVEPVLTDAHGAYELKLPVGGKLQVFVRPAEGRESDHVPIEAVPGQLVVADIELPTGSIAGRVVDDVAGEAVAGLTIDLYRLGNVEVGSCRTSPDGTFRLDWLPPDAYRLRVDGLGRTSEDPKSFDYRKVVLGMTPMDISLTAGQARDDLELTVCRGGSITGDILLPDGSRVQAGTWIRLVRLQDGRIVPSTSRVFAFDGSSDEGRLEESDDPIWAKTYTMDGRYSFTALPPGEYRILTGEATPENVRDEGQSLVLADHAELSMDVVAH